MKRILPILLFAVTLSSAQISSFPYTENFDSVTTPNLPVGWTTTTNRLAGGDFITSTTTLRSVPNCVSSTNGRISQSFITPVFDFSTKFPDSIIFYERRTSTHTSPLLVEASINGDTTFSIPISDTLKLQSSTAYVKRSFALPETLNGKSNVRFRWRVIADSTAGTSGVIRFDDVTVTVKKAVDLSLSSFTVSPTVPKRGETVAATIGIKNRALAGNFSGTVQLFDSLTLVASQNFSQSFAANESLAIQLSYPNITAGRHPLTARLLLSGDEDTTNNSLSTIVNAGYHPRMSLINEIMYAPPTGMPEWVEIVNNSPDTIPISGWRISDAGSTRALITPNRFLSPRSYAVLTTDTNAFKSFYTENIPLFHAQFSALNNSGDAVILFDPAGTTIDTLTFASSWGGSSGGKSLERIDTAVASTLQSNWTTSKHPPGATPGTINSVSKKEFDVTVEMITVSPQFPVAGDVVTVSSMIKNIGKQSAASFVFRLYLDSNNDSIPSPNEIRYEQNIALLTANDSVTVQSTISSLAQGSYRIFGSAVFAQDDDTTNNIRPFSFSVGIPPQSIVITEIMYAPNGDEPEWIECFNRSSNPISLNGWKISDAGTTKSALTNTNSAIPEQSYFIIARDSSFTSYHSITAPLFFATFSSLNNTTPDVVVLFDERGGKIDSVYYKQSWGGSNGNSLQRFDIFGSSSDSANWRSAAASAGIENVVARKDFDVEIKSITSAKSANGTTITATIFNSARMAANSFTLKFYHDTNTDTLAHANELLNSTPVTAIAPTDSASVQFDWIHVFRGKQTVIAVIDFGQDQRLTNNTGIVTTTSSFPTQSIVINEIMYEPLPGNAEFVELFNRSADSIDVAGWKMMDQPSSTGSRAVILLSQEKRIVPPGRYAVIASDSSIFTEFSALAGKFVLVNSSLSLSNSGEDLVLADLTGTQIDSIRYSPSWHLKNIISAGRSLERINPNSNSTDGRNWSSSVAKNGASPMQTNSIYIASASSNSALTLTPNPFSPDNDGFDDFLSINYNLPTNSATIRVRIYDVTGRLIRRLAQSEPSPSNGSIIWNGLDDDGHRVRIGMYIILFEAFDNFGGTVKTMKDVAVVARML
ncbi:MAG: lamin tail domain-containing protein [Ignavibacteriales bacterium]|nr:lamin tail domain-containing protein [Ignavibacteriales bacterium]